MSKINKDQITQRLIDTILEKKILEDAFEKKINPNYMEIEDKYFFNVFESLKPHLEKKGINVSELTSMKEILAFTYGDILEEKKQREKKIALAMVRRGMTGRISNEQGAGPQRYLSEAMQSKLLGYNKRRYDENIHFYAGLNHLITSYLEHLQLKYEILDDYSITNYKKIKRNF